MRTTFHWMILNQPDSEYLKLEMEPTIMSPREHQKKQIFLRTQRPWGIQMPLMKSLA